MAHLPRTLAAALALGLAAAPAYARQSPTPQPSGIVVHLFGPDSIASHILPTVAEPAAPASPATGTAPAGGQPPGQNAATPAAATSSGPTWGDVAHQTFVTGDPAEEGAAALPKGKAAH
jgi:hypothetical protein